MKRFPLTLCKAGVVLGLAVVAGGCAHTGALRNQASHDLRCDEREIEILNGGRLRDVQGCGRKATYKWTGSVWVLYEQPGSGGQSAAPGQPVTYAPVPVQPVQPTPGPGQPGVVYVTPTGAQQPTGVQPVPMGQPQPVNMGK